MPTVNQIVNIIRSTIRITHNSDGVLHNVEEAAEKIVATFDDQGAMLVSAAALENEVTSTLMDMLVGTVLATLFEEEGKGRCNIDYSPMSMDHFMKNYVLETSNEGMVRTVRISLREDSDLNDPAKWREPSNRHGLMHQDESGRGAKPQAEPHEYNRPVWVVAYAGEEDGELRFLECADRANAEGWLRTMASDPTAVIQNRWCLHEACPSSGCSHDETKRDPEVTST